jgi:hypothetical protein
MMVSAVMRRSLPPASSSLGENILLVVRSHTTDRKKYSPEKPRNSGAFLLSKWSDFKSQKADEALAV